MAMSDDEYKLLLTDWLNATKKREVFWSQFISESINGIVTRQNTKIFQADDWKQAEKLDKDEEEKKLKYFTFLKRI